jgi:hypothetical protein
MLRTGAACAGVTAVADGTAAVCGRGASAQATSVVQIAQAPKRPIPEADRKDSLAHPPNCNTFYQYHYIVNGNRSLASKKAPLNAGLELRGRGLAYPALFGRFSFETNVFGPLGSASLFSSADYCERGRCVPAVFGVGVAPDEEPRSGSSSSARESTSGRSTNYGRGHLIRVFRDIGRIVS